VLLINDVQLVGERKDAREASDDSVGRTKSHEATAGGAILRSLRTTRRASRTSRGPLLERGRLDRANAIAKTLSPFDTVCAAGHKVLMASWAP